MKRVLRRRPSASMVVAVTALVVAASGTAIAARSALVSGDKLIEKRSLSGNRLRNHTITGTQVDMRRLGKVPSARSADRAGYADRASYSDRASSAASASDASRAGSASYATSAGSATTATNATNAASATNATNAANAASLGGQPASAFLSSGVLARSGTVILQPGQTGIVLFQSGPLSITIGCTASGGVTTASIDADSTVGNWVSYGGVQSGAGSAHLINSPIDDSASPGNEHGETTRIDLLAPGGQSLHGQASFGVDWPGTGECFFNAYAIS